MPSFGDYGITFENLEQVNISDLLPSHHIDQRIQLRIFHRYKLHPDTCLSAIIIKLLTFEHTCKSLRYQLYYYILIQQVHASLSNA